MSQSAPKAPKMTENSVIKHYKKQLICRQYDKNTNLLNEVSNTKIFSKKEENGKKTRRKRKNKNCRGQFRHEAMELIKLGSTPSNTLCKSRPVKSPPSVIQAPPKTPGHALPQMVPERHARTVIYSPPRRPPLPEYLPPYPPLPLPYRPMPSIVPPPPPYHVARSPPRPVPRSPVRPIPQMHNHGMTHKRKLDEREKVVAAIDLTVDHRTSKHHKCHCECGKTYDNSSVIVTDSSRVPSTYARGSTGQNKSTGLCEQKSPPLFLIDSLLAKKVPPKEVLLEVPKTKDYTVSAIIGSDRRQSVEIDTISISSTSTCSSTSEAIRSPRPKSNGAEKQIPQGKLFYYKNNNSFIRYFDDTQKKLFFKSLTSSGGHASDHEDKEVIELPKNTTFSPKDNLTVEEYVSEMTLVEKFIPRDFFLFYKFVTGYQICHNNLPVSFLTFLKVYNTNGLKQLLERYIHSA